MPPKVKITKESIISVSLDIIRSGGADALNARAIAKKLNCSTQPIFSNYASMQEIREQVIKSANQLYEHYIEEGMKDPSYPPYKASGISYIRFAKEERELFKLLFMRDRTEEETEEKNDMMDTMTQLISSNTGLSHDEAYLFQLEMWIYVHGIATMIATSYLEWDWEMISRMLTDAYQGLKEHYQTKQRKENKHEPCIIGKSSLQGISEI